MQSREYQEICELLDKLYLDTLFLMEEEVQLKINMEKSMADGENNLSKCRYVNGPNSASVMNIPLNPEEDIIPLITVNKSSNVTFPGVNEYELNSSDDPKVTDPVKWFGFFTHQNLLKSQKSYKESLQWAIEAINVQNQLKYLCDKYQVLKDLKLSLAELEE